MKTLEERSSHSPHAYIRSPLLLLKPLSKTNSQQELILINQQELIKIIEN